MSRLRFIGIWLVAALAACSGAPSPANDPAMLDMLERLGYDPADAPCIAGQLGGDYTVEEIQNYGANRDDLTVIDGLLIEAIYNADNACLN